MKIKNLLVSALLAAGAVSVQPASAAPVFADWTAADGTANTASGTLNGVSISLTTTAAPPSLFDANGGVTPFSVTNGTFAGYANGSYFNPSTALTDVISLNSSSNFLITFGAPISNVTLHLFQLADTLVAFDSAFTLQSSDGDLTVTATTVQGVIGSADDANGSLLFAGPISSLSWTASNQNFGDGVGIQFSVDAAAPGGASVPEPGSIALLGLAFAAAVGVRRRSRQS